MLTKPLIRSYYWKENQLSGNLGDALVPILLNALGYEPIPQQATSRRALNPERCLLVIGSLLTEPDLANLRPPLDVWGCGWKGVCPPAALLAQLRIYAVRGPQTVAGLGLPADTPLGDPALLLPRLAPRPIHKHGRPVVVPHIHRTKLMTATERCRLTGCSEVVGTRVIQRQGVGTAGWYSQLLGLNKSWLCLGIRPYTPWGAVERIAGASFVLTGSLHGAILAQAYGVPWAAYDDGYVDAPPKWLDWGAYLGIPIAFVTDLKAGMGWWQTTGAQGRIRDIEPLLAAFPYPRRQSPAAEQQGAVPK
jgi:Polysaccharide pyruvyl transferase